MKGKEAVSCEGRVRLHDISSQKGEIDAKFAIYFLFIFHLILDFLVYNKFG